MAHRRIRIDRLAVIDVIGMGNEQRKVAVVCAAQNRAPVRCRRGRVRLADFADLRAVDRARRGKCSPSHKDAAFGGGAMVARQCRSASSCVLMGIALPFVVLAQPGGLPAPGSSPLACPFVDGDGGAPGLQVTQSVTIDDVDDGGGNAGWNELHRRAIVAAVRRWAKSNR